MSAEEENLRTYFRTIWKDTEGIVYLPSRGEDPKDWKQTIFNWPQEVDRIVQMVQTRSASREVYVNPTIYRGKVYFDDGKIDGKRTLARGNVLGSWVLWADFDGNAKADWPENADIPSPTMRIRTSNVGHQHAYWQLAEFITDPTVLEDKNRALAHQLQADISGWDVSQLLRPPSTTNHKYGKDDRNTYEVRIEESSDRVYPASIVQRESIYRPVVESDLAQIEIPNIRVVLAEGKWSREFLNLFQKDAPTDRSRALGALAFYAAEAGFNDASIYSVIEDADSRWGKYRDRTDRTRRLIDLVDRARKKYPYGAQDVDFGDVFGDSIAVEDAPKIVFNFQEFMDAEVSVEWILEGLFPLKGYGIIYGMPGVGKTLIGIDLAICLTFGQDWLVWKNVGGVQDVLFLSLEMNHPTLKLQIGKMTNSFSQMQRQELSQHLHIAPLAETIPLDTKDGREIVENFLIQYKPSVLFIDSLSESSYKSLLEDEGVRELNRFFRYLREKYNCSVYVVHHDRKSGATKHQDLDSMWGSRFISSAADFILFLEATEPESNHILCINDKNRLGTKEAAFLIDRDWNDFTFTFDGYATTAAKSNSERTQGLINALNRGSAVGGSSYKPSKESIDMFDS